MSVLHQSYLFTFPLATKRFSFKKLALSILSMFSSDPMISFLSVIFSFIILRSHTTILSIKTTGTTTAAERMTWIISLASLFQPSDSSAHVPHILSNLGLFQGPQFTELLTMMKTVIANINIIVIARNRLKNMELLEL